jgi:hypothetical protein
MPTKQDVMPKKQLRTIPVTEALRPADNAAQQIQTAVVIANLHEQVRVRAYELYEQRGREDGHDIEDWIQAEAEILAQNTTLAA